MVSKYIIHSVIIYILLLLQAQSQNELNKLRERISYFQNTQTKNNDKLNTQQNIRKMEQLTLFNEDNNELKEIGEFQILINDQIIQRHFEPNSISYFKFNGNLQNLIIKAEPINNQFNLDIYMSHNVSKPNQYSNQVQVCKLYGMNICPYNQENLQNNNQLYIGVFCAGICVYRLQVQYIKTDILLLNQQNLVFLQKNQQLFLRISIPNDQTIQRIHIESYLLYNNETSTINYSMKAQTPNGFTLVRETPYNRKVSILQKNENLFCVGCNIYITLFSQNSGIFHIQVLTQSNFNKLQINHRVYDIINSNEFLNYQLNYTEFQQINQQETFSIINFEIRIYSGRIKVYNNLNSDEYTDSELININIQFNKLIQSEFDILKIEGILASSYSIYTYIYNQNPLLLQFNTIQSGQLLTNDIINYNLLVYTEQQRIYINLQTEFGLADIYIKKCEQSQCEINSTEIQNYNQNTESITKFDVVTMSSEFTYLHSSMLSCKPTHNQFIGISQCIYALAIKAQNSLSNYMRYSILVKDQLSYISLREGIQESGHLEKGKIQFFNFQSGPYDKSIEKVKFHLTVYSGSGIVYISRKDTYPNQQNHEKMAIGVDDYLIFSEYDTYISDQKIEYNLGSCFYISIQSPEQSYFYSISVSLVRKDNIYKYTPVKLIEGNTAQYSLSRGQDSELFYFDLNLLPEYLGGLKVNLIPVLGQFNIYITSDNQLPNSTYCQYNNTAINEHYMYIQTSDKYFKREGRYYILVQNSNSLIRNTKFIIFYNFVQTITNLIDNTLFQITLNSLEYQYYRVHIQTTDHSVYISKYSDQDTTNLYVSINQQQSYDLESINTKKGIIKINDVQMSNACNELYQIDEEGVLNYNYSYHSCYFYIKIHNPHPHQITMSLMTHKYDNIISLSDGISHSLSFPDSTEIYKFIYQVHNINLPVIISVSSHHGPLYVYVNIYDSSTEQYNVFSKQKFPVNEHQADYYATDTTSPNYQTILIQKQSLITNCKNSCSIAISVRPNSEFVDVGDYDIYQRIQEIKDQYTFEIIVTSTIHYIQEGIPIKGFTQQGEISYYTFSVNKPTQEILISLNPISSGITKILVDKGILQRPTPTKYRWFTENNYIVIQPQDLLIGENIQDKYVIGIQGYTNCIYMISVLFQQQKIQTIITGITQDYILQPNQIIYLQYFHHSNQPFHIKFITDFGNPIILVKSYTKIQNFLQNLPNITYYSWVSETKSHIDLSINSSNSQYCSFCWYIIAIYSSNNQSAKASISLKTQDSYIHIINGKNYIDTMQQYEYNKYMYELNSPQDLEINIHIYYGDIHVYINNEYFYDSFNIDKSQYIINKTHFNNQSTYKLTIPYENTKMHLECKQKNNRQHTNHKCKIFSQYLISISAAQTSMYSLLVKVTDSFTLLRDGLHHTQRLHPKTYHEYIFEAGEQLVNNSQICNIIIQRSQYMPNITLLPDTYILYSEYSNNAINNFSQGISPNIINYYTEPHEGIIHYRISLKNGRYLVRVYNPFDAIYQYTIIMSNKDIRILPLNLNYQSIISIQQTDYYEFVTNEPGLFFLNLDTCIGKVKLKVALNYDKFLKQEYKTTQNQIYIKVNQTGQRIYAAVQFEEDQLLNQQKEALYKIIGQIKKFNEKYFVFQPGNSGRIYHSINEQESILKLVYNPVELLGEIINNKLVQSNTKYQHDSTVQIKYILYLTNNQKYLEFIAQCGALIHNSTNSITSQFQDQHIFLNTFELQCHLNPQNSCEDYIQLTQQGLIYATIKSQVFSKQHGQLTTVAYNTISFYIYFNSYYFLVVIGFIILVLCILVYCIYVKNLKARANLKIEMTHITNIASLKSDYPKNQESDFMLKIKYEKMQKEQLENNPNNL